MAMDQIQTTELFRVLADPTRRGLFERLSREGDLTVSALTLGAHVSQPSVSEHLKALRSVGLVTDERQGRQVIYRARAGGLAPLMNWLGHYEGFWRKRFNQMEDLLKEMDQ
jgi:DNA-binding transcriptional ArsR family regulator